MREGSRDNQKFQSQTVVLISKTLALCDRVKDSMLENLKSNIDIVKGFSRRGRLRDELRFL